MQDAPFEEPSGNALYFSTPQIDDLFQAVLSEINSFRKVVCITGFPKAGKTFFLTHLSARVLPDTIMVAATPKQTLSQTLNKHLAPKGDAKSTLSKRLQEKRRVVLLVDNAHKLKDSDFAFLKEMFTLARKFRCVLQVVLVGNGGLVTRLARPDNNDIYKMVSAVRKLPKLTNGQGAEYIRFLLRSAGLDPDLIADSDDLVKKAGGVIGILRPLTVTIALRKLDELARGPQIQKTLPNATRPSTSPEEPLPVQEETAKPSGSNLLLPLCALALTCLFVFALPHLFPPSDPKKNGSANFTEVLQATSNVTQTPVDALARSTLGLKGENSTAAGETILRKESEGGPYSLQVGSYATLRVLLRNLPRFEELASLFWNKEPGEKPRYGLFVGRFKSQEEADAFAARHGLEGTPVIFRPFVATVGPLKSPEQIREASETVGLPGGQGAFEFRLHGEDAGMDIQFGLASQYEEAEKMCAIAKEKGFSCVVTQYE